MKRANSILGILLLTVGLFSCKKDCPNPTPEPGSPMIIHTISKNCLYGSSSEGFGQENHVINDSVAWNELKTHMNASNDVTYYFSEQEIDFSQWTVLASFDQVQPSGGHSMDYSTVIENENSINATIVHESPQGNATTVITQPYIIVKIQKTSKPVIFN